jgi:sialate O-acetylesterase
VFLDPVQEYGGPHVLTVKGKNTVTFNDVLIGEVWVCAGQSNMQWNVNAANDPDIEKAAAKFPNIRLISVPQVGTQEPQWNFNGKWAACSPDTVGNFSAVGYFFGRQLHQTLGVPVGLINNAWGGSAAEAWVQRDKLAANETLKPLMERWAKTEADFPAAKADSDKKLEEWKAAAEKAKAEGKPAPQQPGNPEGQMKGNARPGNIYCGVLKPSIGYGIKGVIWYQGESNASRAYEHAELFPYLIEQWRQEQGQGDFSFYWVQLADYMAEKPTPGDSTWAELRETQTKTLRLPKTGQAVIIDIGEGRDIHPRNKYDVASRLVRWALVKDYGMKFPYRSPEYQSVAIAGNKATVTLECFGSTLRTFDVTEPRGFAICGEDKVWHWASAKLVGTNQVEVWHPEITAPVAVRYAWADNPVCNLFSADGLPVTPFRTDDFTMTTKPKPPAEKPAP